MPKTEREPAYEEIIALRASGHVRRWHTVPGLLEQNVAAHCAHATTLLLMLHPSPSVDLIKAVLWHDSPERVTGDVPSTAKIRCPPLRVALGEAERLVTEKDYPNLNLVLRWLTTEDCFWLRAVDLIELIMHCGDEILVGNQHFRQVQDRAVTWLRREYDLGNIPRRAYEFLEWYLQHGQRSLA